MIVVLCEWCGEANGWCELTDGPNPCEGVDEFAAAMEDLTEAPRIREPFRVGDRG